MRAYLGTIKGVYIMNAIYGLAGSFVGIFIPIYLLRQNLDPANVFRFYIVYSLGVIVFSFFANYLTRRLGLRKTVLLGYPFLFLYFFLLYTLEKYGVPLYFLAIVSSLQVSLYWFPLHIWLTNTSRMGSIGSDMGRFYAVSQTVGLFAPIVSAVLIGSFGFKVVFVIAVMIYLFSVIPLFYLPEYSFKEKMSLSNFASLFKKYPRLFFVAALEDIRGEAEGIIWPIIIYLSLRNILSVGYVGTISAVGAVLFVLLVGSYADKIDKRKLLGSGALIVAIIWALRMATSSAVASYALTLAASFFAALTLVPISSIMYGVAKRESVSTFILFRESSGVVGRLVLFSLALLLVSSINYIFLLPALACLGTWILSTKNLGDGLQSKLTLD